VVGGNLKLIGAAYTLKKGINTKHRSPMETNRKGRRGWKNVGRNRKGSTDKKKSSHSLCKGGERKTPKDMSTRDPREGLRSREGRKRLSKKGLKSKAAEKPEVRNRQGN